MNTRTSTLLSVFSLAGLIGLGGCDEASKKAAGDQPVEDAKAETKAGAEAAAETPEAGAAAAQPGAEGSAVVQAGDQKVEVDADADGSLVKSGDESVKTDADGSVVNSGSDEVKTDAEGNTQVKSGDAEVSVGKDGKIELKGIPGM